MANDRPQTQVDINDFPGMVTESDVQNLQPGASPEQINCTSEEVGVLMSRKGMLLVKFDDIPSQPVGGWQPVVIFTPAITSPVFVDQDSHANIKGA